MLLKQIYQNIGIFVNRRSEEACLLVAFCQEFKHFVQFSVIGLTEYFLAVHLAERADYYATVCLQDNV